MSENVIDYIFSFKNKIPSLKSTFTYFLICFQYNRSPEKVKLFFVNFYLFFVDFCALFVILYILMADF